MAVADRCEQPFEAGTRDAAAGAAEVLVDDLDVAPAKLLGAIDQAVLASPALMIMRELACCRLPDVDAGAAARCSVVILVIAASPACRLCQRRRDLAQQHLDDCRELAPLSCSQFDARSLGLEQAWLEILGSVRHSLVAPFLIRPPESLEAHRPRCVGSEKHRGENMAHRRSGIETQPRQSSTPEGRQRCRQVGAQRETRRRLAQAVA
jgi:hypothetical protein